MHFWLTKYKIIVLRKRALPPCNPSPWGKPPGPPQMPHAGVTCVFFFSCMYVRPITYDFDFFNFPTNIWPDSGAKKVSK